MSTWALINHGLKATRTSCKGLAANTFGTSAAADLARACAGADDTIVATAISISKTAAAADPADAAAHGDDDSNCLRRTAWVVDEFIAACKTRWPKVLIQFEDFRTKSPSSTQTLFEPIWLACAQYHSLVELTFVVVQILPLLGDSPSSFIPVLVFDACRALSIAMI
eukprot:21430-Heterococcus_DN1.PRE.1